MRGAAGTGTEPNEGYIHFYSRASCEARQRDADAEVAAAPFLLTRLMRGAAFTARRTGLRLLISTHAPHARRGSDKAWGINELLISTHAPHARRGWDSLRKWTGSRISTHAPHARRGMPAGLEYRNHGNFYSRASCEARPNKFPPSIAEIHFYSRASCEARPINYIDKLQIMKFLLTRLMRGAATKMLGRRSILLFLLTRLMRGAAFFDFPSPKTQYNFYSRASCEARLS